MPDYIYVNIFNEGMIPWIKEKGPLFGYRMPVGIYSIISRDPRIKIEFTTPENAEKARKDYLRKIGKLPEEVHHEKEIKSYVEPKKETPVEIEPVVENTTEEEIDPVDAEIDKITEGMDTGIQMDCKIPDDSTAKFRVYSTEELSAMTKAQMKKILIERGYIKGPYAPKYVDKLEDLAQKIRKTQNF